MRRSNSWRSAIATIAILVLLGPLTPASGDGKALAARTRSFEALGQGVSAYRQGEFSLAVDLLEEAAAIALNNFRAHFYLGLALNADRRYDRAIEVLEIAIDLDPLHLQSHIALGDAFLQLGDLQEAEASYFRTLKLRPGYAGGLDGRARIAQARGDEVEAIRLYRESLKSDSGFAPAYTHLGDLLLAQGRVEEAVQLLEQAVSIRADFAPGLNRLAQAYGRLGLTTEAVATIQRAIELQPNNALHKATLGDLQMEQRFWTAAELSFLESLELDPSLPAAQLGLAKLARHFGDYDDAIDQIEAILADARLSYAQRERIEALRLSYVDERDRLARLQTDVMTGEATDEDYAALARIYAARGMWSEAASITERESPSVGQRERLAYLWYRLGRFREAHDLYQELLADAPQARLAVDDGVVLSSLGNDAAALSSYERALQMEPDNIRARLYRANSLLRLGREADAVEAYDAFVRDHPRGEDAERVRRILKLLAPERVRPLPDPTEQPVPAPPPPRTPASRTEESR